MYIENTQCCAVDEISELSHHNDPRETMRLWYNQVMNNDPDDYGWYHNQQEIEKMNIPAAFYIFTGVVKHTDGTRPKLNGKYGPNFATYIRRHRLGKLTESEMRANRVNHPKHYVKIWTWAPSIKNLKKWYKREFKNG